MSVPSVDKGTHGFAPQICDFAALLSLSVRPVRFVPVPCRIANLQRKTPSYPKYRLLAAGGVNVNRRTSSTPHSVALPATKIRHLGSEGVLRHRFVILQGTGTKRTGRTLSDSNAAESQICGAKPCVPLSTEGIVKKL